MYTKLKNHNNTNRKRCTVMVRLFWVSPKPACLVATENKIFRKSSSCWPKFTPLTRKWIYTLIFTSIHFRKEREREREREKREPRSERERKKRLRWWSRRSSINERTRRTIALLVNWRAAWSTSGVIVQRARSSIVTARRSARSRSTAATIVERCNRDLDDRGAIAPSFFWVCLVCLFLLLLQTTENIFQKIF